MGRKKTMKCTRGISLVLSIIMTVGLAFSGVIPGTSTKVYAADCDITENFDSYSSVSEVKGYNFGNPTLSLVDDGNGGQALQVSERTQGYYAYAYNASAFRGNKINVSFDITLPDFSEAKNFSATMKTTKTGADDGYVSVIGGTISDGNSTHFSITEYEVPIDVDSADIYFETEADVNYIIDNVVIEVEGNYVDPSGFVPYADISGYESLKALYQDYFKIGLACEAISHWNNNLCEIGNANKEELLLKEANSITFGNELKPAYNMGYNDASATEENLPFVIDTSAKEMLDWAREKGMKVRGHVLVWHSQCEDAVFCVNYTPIYKDASKTKLDPTCYVDKDTMLKRLESYIDSTMKYMYENGYGDVIYAWDVVNEAVEPGTNEYDLRNSYWYQIIGPDFMYYAFKYAREASIKYSKENATLYEADPNDDTELKRIQPKLFYNDYNEAQAAKVSAIIKLLSTDINGHNVLSEGYIDGIGMQGHLADNTDIETYINALKAYDAVFDEVQITELDVAETSSGINADYYQGVFYQNLFTELIKAVDDGANLTCVTVWGLTDDNSWRKESSPLLFEADLSKKLAFDGIVNAIKGGELPPPDFEAPDFSDDFYDFESSADGITPRGDSKIDVQTTEVFSGKQALSVTGRGANWHGASFDVSRFVGQTIDISAWVKSASSEVKISADIDNLWPNITSVDTSSGQWVQIKGTYAIPSNLTALKLYFETGDTEDIYIDNLKVKLSGLEEGFEGSTHIATPRGVGHMPVLTVTDTKKHTGEKSLLVTREAQEATLSFDVSKYIGKNIMVSASILTDDTSVVIGLDGDNPVEIVRNDNVSSNVWTNMSGLYRIPENLKSAQIYIETNGASDVYVDDFKVWIYEYYLDDLETDASGFGVRWGGAGNVEYIEDGLTPEGEKNHAVKLTGRDESYYGLVFDVSEFLGSEVEITFDAKTDDEEIYITGDIDNVWPRYVTAKANPGEYTSVGCVVTLPKDLSSLKVYVETNGKSDIILDNLTVKRVKIDEEYVVNFDASPNSDLSSKNAFAKDYLITAPVIEGDKVPLGWYTDKKLTKEWNFNTDRITKDLTLYAKWDNGGNNPSPKPSTVDSLIGRLYESILDRKASDDEIKDWSDKVTNKEVDISVVVYEFFTSDEFKKKELTDEQYLDILYKTFFGRKADEAGKAYWTDAMKAGNTRESILSGFIESQEFEKLCDKSGVERSLITGDGTPVNVNMYNFAKRLYECCLSRAGETTGVEYWVERMMSGKSTPGEAAKQFFQSKEFVDKNLGDKEYVNLLYKTFMDREPEAGGAEYWLGKIAEGMTRDDVIDGFIDSVEFKGLLDGFGL